MSLRQSRLLLWLTALCALGGVVLSVRTSVLNHGGHFHPGLARGVNTFAFFTTDSNVLAGVVAVLLALRPTRREGWFAWLALSALIMITVTGLVFQVALRGVFDLATSWDRFGNELVHTVMPLLTVIGWLVAWPRGLFSSRTARLAILLPLSWLVFTLVRGAIAHWYPYPFMDVTRLGYGPTLVNCVWVTLLFLILAGLGVAIDRRRGSPPGLPVPPPPAAVKSP
jgi:hypothetical protein